MAETQLVNHRTNSREFAVDIDPETAKWLITWGTASITLQVTSGWIQPARDFQALLQSPDLAEFAVDLDRARPLWAKSFLNQPAPPLEVEQWLTEKPDMQGRFVLVDFWATWCGPCRGAFPERNEIPEKFRDQLVVVGLSDESAATVRKFQNEARSKHPEWITHYATAIDAQKRISRAVGVEAIPPVMIIDPRGILRWEGLPSFFDHSLSVDVVRAIIRRYATAGP